jgi:hypothetical protein
MTADEHWLRHLFGVFPMLAGVSLLAIAGARLLGSHLAGIPLAAAASLCLLTFVGLLALGNIGGWNHLLLGCFGVLIGAVTGAVVHVPAEVWVMNVVWSGLAAAAGGTAGLVLGVRLKRLARLLWMVAWIYLVGWVVMALWPIDFAEVWGVVGVGVFTCLVGARTATWRLRMPPDSIPIEAATLLLLLGNLLLAVVVLGG